MKRKIYIYESEKTACWVVKVVSWNFNVQVERQCSALKMDSRIYDKLAEKDYTPKAKWICDDSH